MGALSPAVSECYLDGIMDCMDCKAQLESRSSRQVCLLIYDGACRLCVSTKQKLEEVGVGQAESDVRFLAYQSEAAKSILGSTYRVGRPDAAFLIRPSGEVLQGLDAVLPLIRHLPGGKLLLGWLRFSPIRLLAEWSYRMVARHRYRWFGEADPHSRQD
jgi:predicted DCC family thiol-disulfide oxidoreductase YuxK